MEASTTERKAPEGLAIGRIVIYRSRTFGGPLIDYDVPAIVTATVDTLNPNGVELGHIPDLSGNNCVHLTCFTAGKSGKRREAEDFKRESPHGRGENVAGCYQEWDIPSADEAGWISPGTWRWPSSL